MIIDETDELQMYVNFIMSEKNYKYDDVADLIKDLRDEYNVKPKDEEQVKEIILIKKN